LISLSDRVNSIYIHIPFCRERCHYCDFYSSRIGENNSLIKPYIEAIKKELIRYQYYCDKIKTIYVGGGTPSVIPHNYLADLLNFLSRELTFEKGYEFTIEANPESITREFLNVICESNLINRISLGIQSLNDGILKRLGRIHNRERALKGLESIFSTGFKNISVDFLVGVTDDTDDFIQQIITFTKNFPVTHISAYILTADREKEELKEFLCINEDTITEQYIKLHNILTERGFVHYEVSNYSRPSFESRHNINYWQNGLYLGLGASAAGYIIYKNGDRIRYKNISDLKRYIIGISQNNEVYEEYEHIDRRKYLNEAIMLALRTIEGINLLQIRDKMTEQEFDLFLKKMENLQKDGYILVSDSRITPTLKGFLFNNYIIRELLL
jgi:oxygen-independent coproporphyrinogen-3 oxidase